MSGVTAQTIDAPCGESASAIAETTSTPCLSSAAAAAGPRASSIRAARCRRVATMLSSSPRRAAVRQAPTGAVESAASLHSAVCGKAVVGADAADALASPGSQRLPAGASASWARPRLTHAGARWHESRHASSAGPSRNRAVFHLCSCRRSGTEQRGLQRTRGSGGRESKGCRTLPGPVGSRRNGCRCYRVARSGSGDSSGRLVEAT
jgi:hypothetical protein